MKQWLFFSVSLVLLLTAFALSVGAGNPPATLAQGPDSLPEGQFVVRIYYNTTADIKQLSAYDVWEYNNRKEHYFLAAVDANEYAEIAHKGFRLEIDREKTVEINQKVIPSAAQQSGIPGYPCYRTVEETFASAQQMVADYPDLATWIDIGDSWEKTDPGGEPGYDMMVLKLTNNQVAGPKPKLFNMSAVHAREYTPAELNTRFAEYLVQNYGIDADVTWLLDYHEIHLLLQANPDGRKQAETGLSWRKNTNQNYCSPTSNNRGADLNRNFEFHWGCCGGSSGSQCDLTYRGPTPASEPEVQSIQDYVRSIYPDLREDDLNAAAPLTTTGAFIDIHSYSELVLWPWGFTNAVAPNGVAMQTLGRKFADFNGYHPEQAIGLYPTDGTTDDFAYGELGLPSYTFELGTSFFQSCSVFENTILPDNLPALIYAAKVVRAPYLIPAGPDVTDIALAQAAVAPGDLTTLTVTADDTRFNNSNGSEPTQPIQAVEYTIDVPDWVTTPPPTPVAMAATDGSFDSTVEGAEATIDSTGLASGRHTIFVRAQDQAGNWGAVSAIFLYVIDPATAPIIEGYVLQAGTSVPLPATISGGIGTAVTNPGTGFYQMQVISDTYDLVASAPEHASETISGVQAHDLQTVQVDFALDPICTLSADDFETPGLWWQGDPSWARSTEDSHSPTHAWTDSPGGNYGIYRDISLTSGIYDFGDASNITLHFWQICDTEATYDFCLVEASTNGGSTWVELARYDSSQSDWEEVSLDASLLDNQADARIRFRFTSDGSITGDGWHVDDVRFSGDSPGCSSAVPTQPQVVGNPDGTDVVLNWMHEGDNDEYDVYRSLIPTFIPGPATFVATLPAPTAIYTDTGYLGDVGANYYYTVRARVNATSLVFDSNTVGEFDYALVGGS